MSKPSSHKVQTRQQPSTQQIVQRVEHYEGALPHPAMLADFDRVVPGAAERLLKLAEQEAQHRISSEQAILAGNLKSQQAHSEILVNQLKTTQISDTIGQLSGFVVCLACIGAAIYMGTLGQTVVAVALAAIPTAAIIRAFYRKPASK